MKWQDDGGWSQCHLSLFVLLLLLYLLLSIYLFDLPIDDDRLLTDEACPFVRHYKNKIKLTDIICDVSLLVVRLQQTHQKRKKTKTSALIRVLNRTRSTEQR